MDALHSELWRGICAFQIDDPNSELMFSERLARDHGWSAEYARRVIEEYKRFVLLAMVAEHEVTPSHDVDEAWHLHLLYTRSYWDELCRKILGRPLHHVPTRGGAHERTRHSTQYLQTLATYAEVFGGAPPRDIWPTGQNVASVPRRTTERRTISLRGRATLVFGALTVPLVVSMVNPLGLKGPEFLAMYTLVGIIAVVAAMVVRYICRDDSPVSDSRELTPTEIACLAGGTPGVLRACLASLIAHKRLKFDTSHLQAKSWWSSRQTAPKLISTDSPVHNASAVEKSMLERAAGMPVTIKDVLDAGLPAAEKIHDDLTNRGWLESAETFVSARWWPLLPLAVVWLLGASKVIVGLERNRPVGFLIAMLVALLIVMLLFWRQPLRTKRGNELFNTLKERHQRLRNYALTLDRRTDAASVSSDLLLAAGLFGLATILEPDVVLLRQHMRPDGGDSFGSFSSACGGSGCGGGGGGCGGGGCGGGGCGGCGS